MSTHPLRSAVRRLLSPVLALVLAASVGLAAAPAAHGQNSPFRSSAKVLAAFKDAIAKPSESTVRILVDKKPAALGTVVGADGWILTKNSLLKEAPVCLLRDGREFAATVIGHDDRFDLALLKIEYAGLKPVEWGASEAAPVGYWVASPGTAEEPVAIGVVSVATRNMPVPKPSATPKPGGGYLGIGLAEDTVARVAQVMAGQAAEKAGLKVDDVILSVNGKEVSDGEALIAALQRYQPDDVIKLTVKRGDKEMELEAKLGKRPAGFNRGDFQNRLGSELSQLRHYPTILHHDSVLKPTDCGGPLVDLEGRAIGINIARVGRTESNAIPAEVVRPLLDKLMPEKISVPRRVD